MSTLTSPQTFNWRFTLTTTAKVLLTCVAGFWTWFALMHLFGTDEGASKGSLVPVTLLSMSLALIATTCWVIPRVGGVLAIFGGIAMALIFRGAWGIGAMAAPLTVLGAVILVMSLRPRR